MNFNYLKRLDPDVEEVRVWDLTWCGMDAWPEIDTIPMGVVLRLALALAPLWTGSS